MIQLHHDESRALAVMLPLGQTMFALVVLTLVLRLGTRLFLLRRVGLDDFAIVLASVSPLLDSKRMQANVFKGSCLRWSRMHLAGH